MFARYDSHKVMISTMLVIALVAVALPLCAMIGCDMAMGNMVTSSPYGGPAISAVCQGVWAASTAQISLLPTNFFAALVAMVAVLGLAGFVLPMLSVSRPVYVFGANAPPAPIAPLGERFRV